MQHSKHLWRAFALLIVTFNLTSCTTPPRTKTTEIIEITTVQSARGHDYELIDHKYFVVYYDRKFRLARWVKYELTKEKAGAHVAKRRNRFKADPLLKTRGDVAVSPLEYRKTGYDQGHLAPSADFAFSQEANDETFVMSNMVPQKPKLNRIAWRMLEEKVRRWACGEEKITVITGPLLDQEMDSLPSGLPIPNEFFKIVYDETPPRKVIAFIYKQNDATNVMTDRVADLKTIDQRTGEPFSTYLPQETRTPSQSNQWKECSP